MRTISYATFAALLFSMTGVAQQTSTTEGLACFENTPMPEYPRTALGERVDGSIWATVHVSPQGSIEKIDTRAVSAWRESEKLLAPAVDKAIHAAKIKSDCDGKTVTVVFKYEIHGDPTAMPKPNSYAAPPNTVVIDSQPATHTHAGD